MRLPRSTREGPKPTSTLPEAVASSLDLESGPGISHGFIVFELLPFGVQSSTDCLSRDVSHLDPAVGEYGFQELDAVRFGCVGR